MMESNQPLACWRVWIRKCRLTGGRPYWAISSSEILFHQLSGAEMEIRLAGLDKVMWTALPYLVIRQGNC